MKRIYTLLVYCTLFSIVLYAPFAYSDFSFKEMTSWIKGTKEETDFKEIPFDKNGTIILENEVGSVGIKSWSLPKIAIETIKRAPAKELPELKIETTIAKNQLSIRTVNGKKNGSVEYNLIVPTQTNVIVKGTHCPIKTKNISGVHQLSTQGAIDIQGACNTIHALTENSISVAFTTLPEQASISLKSLKSSVCLTLPQATDATIHAKTLYSSVTSQHRITLKPITVLLNKKTWDQWKKTIDGTLGSGKASIDISAYNGITIQ